MLCGGEPWFMLRNVDRPAGADQKKLCRTVRLGYPTGIPSTIIPGAILVI